MRIRNWRLFNVALFVALMATLASGQQTTEQSDPNLPSLQLGNELNLELSFGGSQGGNEVGFQGEFRVLDEGRDGLLSIQATMQPHWHMFSITQPDGGPLRTELDVKESAEFELTGPFTADRRPMEKHFEFWTVPAEEHEGEVVWSAPIRLSDGVDAQSLTIDVTVTGQVCADESIGGQCISVGPRVVPAKFAGNLEPREVTQEYRASRSHVTWSGFIQPSQVKPGDEVSLVLTAVPDSQWHLYARADKDPEEVTKPTVIGIKDGPAWPVRQPVASAEPVKKETGFAQQPVQYYYEHPVSWTISWTVPAEAEIGTYPVHGVIGFQTCNEAGTCDPPGAASFTAVISLGETDQSGRVAIEFDEFKSFDEANELAADAPWIDSTAVNGEPEKGTPNLDLANIEAETSSAGGSSTVVVLLTAFVAGFILNFMPCVLPVIGLKVMAFVQQAGEGRSRIFILNMWYVLGLMSVFLVLAILAVFVGLSWGEQFNTPLFNVILTSIVFAFALSFLGVWEIPVPGFASSGQMDKLAQKEGAIGAFSKGILTTILATPCAGPMLVPALAWAAGQPPAIAFAAYASVGLGMASPYLVIGVFPGLVSYLPKPGPWMDTFKHAMGFVLLGTVVILLTFVPVEYVVPIVALLIGLWTALWWVGRVPLYDPVGKQLRAWTEGAIFAALIGWLSFGLLFNEMQHRLEVRIGHAVAQQGGRTDGDQDDEDHLPWQPYSLTLLEQLISQNKTVFVDFTAPS